MKLSEELKKKGWYLKEQFVEKYSTCNEVISVALNTDLREIGAGALSAKREESIPGRIVLQINKVRNIAAPKAREDSKQAPRLLIVDLSDGQITVQALDLGFVSAIDLKTVPGTKIYFRAERLRLMQGFIILNASELEVLGGKVPSLVEKWEFAQTMKLCTLMGRRSNSGSGPPAWIAFEKRNSGNSDASVNDRNFKSLKSIAPKEDKVNEEFTNMRSEAIDQANKIGIKKVFGGGNQKILDHNIKNITAKGYSELEAKEALRVTNNNLERALYHLKRGQVENAAEKQKRHLNRNYSKQTEDESLISKPISNGALTLYDFLKHEAADKPELQVIDKPKREVTTDYKYPDQQHDNRNQQHIRSKVYGQRSYNRNDYNAPIASKTDDLKKNNVNNTIITKSEDTKKNNVGIAKNVESNQIKKRMPQQYERNDRNIERNNAQSNVPNTSSSANLESESKTFSQKPRATSNRNQKPSNIFYDSSKIVGFQSREANDYAISVIKNQSQSKSFSNSDKPKQYPDRPQTTPQDSLLNFPAITSTSTNQKSNTQHAPAGVQSKNGTNASSWNWKIGDFCIAKYWDDGQYYDAQITAVSENTCVVLFLNYGNYEEVLKNDCLPITDNVRSNFDKRTNFTRGPRRVRKPRNTDEPKTHNEIRNVKN